MMPDAPVMPMIIRFMQGSVRSVRRASGAVVQWWSKGVAARVADEAGALLRGAAVAATGRHRGQAR